MINNDYVTGNEPGTFGGKYGVKPYLWLISSFEMTEMSDRDWEESLAAHKAYRFQLADRLTNDDVVDLLHVHAKEQEVMEGAMLRLLSKHGIARDSMPWP